MSSLRAVSSSPPFQGGRCPLPFTPRPPSPPPILVGLITFKHICSINVNTCFCFYKTDTNCQMSQPAKRSSATCLPWNSQVNDKSFSHHPNCHHPHNNKTWNLSILLHRINSKYFQYHPRKRVDRDIFTKKCE